MNVFAPETQLREPLIRGSLERFVVVCRRECSRHDTQELRTLVEEAGAALHDVLRPCPRPGVSRFMRLSDRSHGQAGRKAGTTTGERAVAAHLS